MSKLLKKIGLNSRKALNSSISPKKKNKVLKDFVKLIEINKNKIISENKKDIFNRSNIIKNEKNILHGDEGFKGYNFQL